MSRKHENVLICAPGLFGIRAGGQYRPVPAFSVHDYIEKRLLPLGRNSFRYQRGYRHDLPVHADQPTGRVIPIEIIGKAAEKAAEHDALLVLDECFLDFTDAISAKSLDPGVKNLVILKAFTKIFRHGGPSARLYFMLRYRCFKPNRRGRTVLERFRTRPIRGHCRLRAFRLCCKNTIGDSNGARLPHVRAARPRPYRL